MGAWVGINITLRKTKSKYFLIVKT